MPISTEHATQTRRVILDTKPYTDRASKAHYTARRFAPQLAGSVLDVGCDLGLLRGLVADPSRYTGVDFTEHADLVVDLDREPLPFADRDVDCVVCTDVLEHLERAHGVLDELCRVSGAWVIISLPNPLRDLIEYLYLGKEGRLKHYGLPAEPVKDRHRWFYGADEAEAFAIEGAKRNGFAIHTLEFEPPTGIYWNNAEGVDVLGSDRCKLGAMWALLRRA